MTDRQQILSPMSKELPLNFPFNIIKNKKYNKETENKKQKEWVWFTYLQNVKGVRRNTHGQVSL